ncbi:hypothetical protein BKA70DRAFT_1276991 [Coprinopsis sp. MPI-PUGE-AT-0042]|nr:hypothetical protein BKA70DRAFT_1348120 [Coprinopsis sp. MPI-PUGE-AT-0042]KAH6909692.1 hypothetical protein BKA70DRAFT_1276991 [Coprinopsis sp. MPI-PUGE-AT-0042]
MAFFSPESPGTLAYSSQTDRRSYTSGHDTGPHSDWRQSQTPIDPELESRHPEPCHLKHMKSVEYLRQRFLLDQVQYDDLVEYLMICTMGGDLMPAHELVSKLFAMARQMAAENRLYQQLLKADRTHDTEIQNILADITARLGSSFAVTPEIVKTIRIVAIQLMLEPTRTCWKELDHDTEVELGRNKDSYNIREIFEHPAWLKELRRVIRSSVASVRNKFREQLRDSLFGSKKSSANAFVLGTARRYHRKVGGPKDELPYFWQAIILRKIALDNRAVLNRADDDEEAETPSPPGSKRRRGEGRIPDGEDWWGIVDAWFKREMKTRGTNLTEGQWPELIQAAAVEDIGVYGGTAPTVDDDYFHPAMPSQPAGPPVQGSVAAAAASGPATNIHSLLGHYTT